MKKSGWREFQFDTLGPKKKLVDSFAGNIFKLNFTCENYCNSVTFVLRLQAIIWTNDGLVCWRVDATIGRDELCYEALLMIVRNCFVQWIRAE